MPRSNRKNIEESDEYETDEDYLPLPSVDAESENEELETVLTRQTLRAKGAMRSVRKSKISQSKNRQPKSKVNLSNYMRQQPPKQKSSRAKKKKNIKNKIWINGDFEKTTKFHKLHDGFAKYNSLSPTELFEIFFTDNIWNHIQSETTKYALSLAFPDPKITVPELKCFVGILIVSGYNVLPGKKFYWDSGKDVGNEFVIDAMRRDRFIEIMRFMHWADNNQPSTSDKLWKIRPVSDMLKANFLEHFVATEHLNYDESMVKYYGRHGIKQFIRGKPIRFGYKVWCFNAENGYLVNYEMYQGKSVKTDKEYENLFGKSTAPLVQMLDQLPEKDLPYQIFTDNLFTSFNLLTTLRKRGYGVTGTMRKNRLPKDCPLPTKSEMLEKGRGAFASIISKDDGVFIVRWTDNAVVTMGSTTYGVQPLSNAKRYSKQEKAKVEVERPHVIAMYNKYMGGTDRMDQDLARNRISIRGKKWYWPLLTWLIDAAIQNAWTLFKCSGRKATNLKFRRSLANTYLNRYGIPRKQVGRPTTKKVSDELRYDGVNHLVQSTPMKARRRCAREKCKSSVRTQCRKFNKGLCIDCFIPFHTK